MDKCIGELFKILQEMNVFDNSLIIITADHGEGFQEEHGYMLHGYPYYYEEQMHVPLIVKPPKENSDLKTGGKRIESLVEIIDIMPSILDYLHINISNIKLQGKSFLRLLNYDANKRNYIFGFGSDALGRGPKDNLMVRSKRWKLISDGGLKEERFKLFDLENDTKEQKNLVKKRLDIKTELVGKLIEKIEESKKLRMEIFRKHQDNSCEELFSEVKKEELEALGYIE
jgi:arylsulfatase A-like enzyme